MMYANYAKQSIPNYNLVDDFLGFIKETSICGIGYNLWKKKKSREQIWTHAKKTTGRRIPPDQSNY